MTGLGMDPMWFYDEAGEQDGLPPGHLQPFVIRSIPPM